VAARLTAYIVALIVGSTVIAGLIVGAQRSEDGPVDVMVVNGRVYTADGEGATAEAVAIQGNKIVSVGSTREIQRLRRPQTVVIDAKGGSVLPGFTQTDAPLVGAPGEAAEAPFVGPVAEATRADQLAAFRQAISNAHRRGVTSLHSVGNTPDQLEIFDQLRRDNALSLRVYGALSVAPDISESELDELDELRAKFPDDPFFKAGAAEVSFDAGDVTRQEIGNLVSELDRRDWQIVIEARDDEAVAMALEAFKRAIASNTAPARGRRHRIEVAGIVGPVDFAPFEALGIVASYPGDPPSIDETIDAHTRNAAWMSFDEHRKGSLARDMLADVVVLSTDIFSRPVERLSDAEVSVTIFDGKVVFQKATDTDY
jgi:predicted amidohydrolase YtcJ